MKKFTPKAKTAVQILLKSKNFTEAEIASLLSVPLKGVREVSNSQIKKQDNAAR